MVTKRNFSKPIQTLQAAKVIVALKHMYGAYCNIRKRWKDIAIEKQKDSAVLSSQELIKYYADV